MTAKFVPFAIVAAFLMVGCSDSSSPVASTDTGTTASQTSGSDVAKTEESKDTSSTESSAPETMNETMQTPTGRVPKDGEEVAVLKTAQGDITIQFFPDVAPNHVARFKECVTKGIYKGTFFHRVIPGFMIQGGDPNTKDGDKSNDGMGGYGSMLKQEFNSLKHVPGILSAARTADPNSAQSQFFLMHKTSPHLDNQYTIYGQVIKGLEVIEKIVMLDRDRNDNPKNSDDARIIDCKLEKYQAPKN